LPTGGYLEQWTGLVALLIQNRGNLDPAQVLKGGTFVKRRFDEKQVTKQVGTQ
jgi:hypothetical protein